MRIFQKLVAVIALSGLCLAAGMPSESETAKTKKAKHEAKKTAVSADQLRELKEAMDQQNAALQQMQQQLKQTQEQLQQTQSQLNQAKQAAAAADAKATEAQANSNMQVKKVEADLSDVRTSLASTTETAKKAEKAAADLEHPNALAYKNVRLTPGGFVDFTGDFRTHALNSGPATLFNSVPLGTSLKGVGGLTEYNASARASQLKLRIDSEAGTTKLAAYFEGDFYGISQANPNQTSSWPFRVRQAWGRATFANGWKVTGGQMWNLITMNRKAADTDAVWVPATLDSNYVAGWDWGRQAEFRLAKELNNNLTFAVALTDPSGLSQLNNTTDPAVAGVVSTGAGNLANSYLTSCTGTASTTSGAATLLCPASQLYSTNVAPDVIAKLAYDDPKFGHYEVKGIARFFRDRVNGTTNNNSATGAGIGGGAIIPVLPKKVDFVAQGMYGKGISRYQDSGQNDFIVRTNAYTNANGTNSAVTSGADQGLQPQKAFSAVFGFETHPTPKLELDTYFGGEYYYKDTYTVTTIATGAPKLLGYGSSNAASNKSIVDGTVVLWYDVAKGRFGTLRYGAQYEYVERTMWTTQTGTPTGGYKGVDNDAYVGMRYILP